MPNLEFWRVKRSAMNAKSSDRFDELAKVSQTHDFMMCFDYVLFSM